MSFKCGSFLHQQLLWISLALTQCLLSTHRSSFVINLCDPSRFSLSLFLCWYYRFEQCWGMVFLAEYIIHSFLVQWYRFCLLQLYILVLSCLLTFKCQSYSFLPIMHNFGFFQSNSFKPPLQRLIFPFLIISPYCCICGLGCGGLGLNDYPKGTRFRFSLFTKFDNFESCGLLVSKWNGLFLKYLTYCPHLFDYAYFNQ